MGGCMSVLRASGLHSRADDGPSHGPSLDLHGYKQGCEGTFVCKIMHLQNMAPGAELLGQG